MITEEQSIGASEVVEGEVPDAPLVFQCGRCRYILGDSFSFVCADQALKVVCLSAVTSVVELTQKMVLSTGGVDNGCVYQELKCKNCKDYTIGKLYTATPKPFVHMQQLYSFDTEAITSFVLGSAEICADGTALEPLPSTQHLRSLTGDLLKLQYVLVGIDARLQAMEAELRELRHSKSGQEETTK